MFTTLRNYAALSFARSSLAAVSLVCFVRNDARADSEVVYLTNCEHSNGTVSSEVNWYRDAAASLNGEQPDAHSDVSFDNSVQWEGNTVAARFADGNTFVSNIRDHDGPVGAAKGEGHNDFHGFTCYQDNWRTLYKYEDKICHSVYWCSETSNTPAPAPATTVSRWNCFTPDGRYHDQVTIDWGHRPADGTWACNHWIAACNGNCVASGNASAPGRCDVNRRLDGCSVPDGFGKYKDILRPACDAHDACYHAPWAAIESGSRGYDRCNDNLRQDLVQICTELHDLECGAVIGSWIAGEFFLTDKLREAYTNDQRWVSESCSMDTLSWPDGPTSSPDGPCVINGMNVC